MLRHPKMQSHPLSRLVELTHCLTVGRTGPGPVLPIGDIGSHLGQHEEGGGIFGSASIN